MRPADPDLLKSFYQALIDRPLDPESDRAIYVPFYADRAISPSDPISELQATIEWSPYESAQLLSGFRGTGKSTELRRLKRQLEAAGHAVVLCDMQRYMNMSTAVDVSDFLLAMTGALGEELGRDPGLRGVTLIEEGYWARFVNFLRRTRVELPEISLPGDLKLNLKDDPSFREKLQERLRGHLGALVRDVHQFIGECVNALRTARQDPSLKVVLLLDSVEQIRGASGNATEVADSLETLFHDHADKLRIPYLHVVYTVPPWLKIRSPGVAGLYSAAQHLPCVKVRERDGTPCKAGLDELERVVSARGDWRRLFGQDRQALDELLLASGGYLRDLFRVLQTVLRLSRHEVLPVSPRVRELALHEVRNSYLPITQQDARWLAQVQKTGSALLESQEKLPDLARLFDTHLMLTWRNGAEWFGVHPLIVDEVSRLGEGT